MAFIDSLLLDRLAYGFSGGPVYDTTKVELRSGRIKRNANRSKPRHRYTAPFNHIQPAHVSTLTAAFNACLGSTNSFRFFDRNDYLLTAVNIGTATGATDQTLQLIKPYSFGATTTNRTITKPVDSTASYGRGESVLGAAPAFVFTEENLTASPQVAATPISFSLDYATGIVTFTSTIGYTIRATGWFDVPVFFARDELSISAMDKNAFSTDIDLLEDFSA